MHRRCSRCVLGGDLCCQEGLLPLPALPPCCAAVCCAEQSCQQVLFDAGCCWQGLLCDLPVGMPAPLNLFMLHGAPPAPCSRPRQPPLLVMCLGGGYLPVRGRPVKGSTPTQGCFVVPLPPSSPGHHSSVQQRLPDLLFFDGRSWGRCCGAVTET